MRQDTVIDYAYPLMMVEKAVKEAHDRFLDGDYDSGMAALDNAMVNLRTTKLSVMHMKEQRDALRQQA